MTKILVPITHNELGGSQIFLLKLIDGMKEDKNFTFSCWLFEPGPLEQEFKKRNIPCKLMNFSPKKNPFSLFKLVSLLKEEKPDIIYLHASRILALAARIAGIPCVERINMSRNIQQIGGWCRNILIDRTFTNFNSKVLAVSDAIKRQLLERGVKENKITVIRNFVELDRFQKSDEKTEYRKELGLPENALIVLNVGRFTPQKAQTDFLKIAAEALKSNPELYFVMIGEGPLENDLRSEAQHLNLGEHLIILPFRKDVEKLYAAADIMLHSAHWDPLANVLLEAMASGLPVIATDVDGTNEVIIHKETGMLFPPEDIGKGTELLLEAAAAEEVREKLGSSARRFVEENHSLKTVTDQFKNLFSNRG